MAQFEYFATFPESIEILRELCRSGFEVIPNRPYDRPDAPRHTEVTAELVRLMKEGPGFYMSGAFTKRPIQYIDLDPGKADGQYAVDLLSLGPVMQCSLARLNVVDSLPTLLRGTLSYQSEGYQNPDTNLWEKPSDELKAAYKKAVAITKKHTVPYRSGIAIRIGPEALRLLERGEARITYPGFVNPAPSADGAPSR